MRLPLLIVASLFLNVACGTKGPLTLPAKPAVDASTKAETQR